MSLNNKNVIYQNIVMEGDEYNLEETVMEEESEIDQNINVIKKETKHIKSSEKKSDYEDGEVIGTINDTESLFVGIKQEWTAEGEASSKNLDSLDSEDERTEFYIEKGTDAEEEDDDGEETIAMFVTASGQQLALYAVEDSDDYFAVAVYDESGEPPSNFQFLMKSDVERLIREGAVRTVKKPTQIKKQLVTTQPPVFIPKEEVSGDVLKTENQSELDNCHNFDNKKSKVSTNYVPEDLPAPKIIRLEDSGSEEELVEQSTVQYILYDGDQSDTELTFDEIQATLKDMKPINPKKHHKNISIEKPPEHKKANNGLLYVASTPIRNTSYRAQYYSKPMQIDQPLPAPSPVKRSHISNTSIIGSKQNHGIKRELSPISDYYTPNTSANFSYSESSINTNSQSKVKRPRKQQLTSVNREDSEIIIQPASMLEEEEEIPIPRKRGKRRKKHMKGHEKISKYSKLPTRKSTRRRRTRVEIIDIDMDDEDSDEPSARKEILEITLDEGKEKGSSDKENEVIMVGDSEGEEDDSSKSASLKCKHCSKVFKQRRAFDSHTRICTKLRGRSRQLSDRLTTDESETEDESPKEKKKNKSKDSKPKKEYTCKTCEEKFDMVVTLARHVRAEHTPRKRGRPSKADAKKMKLQETVRIKNQEKKNAEEKSKQKYKKEEEETTTDDETFSKEVEAEEEEEEQEVEEELEKVEEIENKIVPKIEKVTEKNCESDSSKIRKNTLFKKTKQEKLIDLHRKWKFAELTCTTCNRWFPSASAYETHSLQHFTKRSMKIYKSRSLYKCPVCNKLFKSQYIFMKHTKMHAKAEKSFKSEESKNLQKTQSDEKDMNQVSDIRQRGRPRKVQSNV